MTRDAEDLRLAHAELQRLVAAIDEGARYNAGQLGWPTVLADAGLIQVDEGGWVQPTAAGRRLARIELRKVRP